MKPNDVSATIYELLVGAALVNKGLDVEMVPETIEHPRAGFSLARPASSYRRRMQEAAGPIDI